MLFSILCSLFITLVFGGNTDNPYTGKTVYVQQAYVNEVQISINLHPSMASTLKKYQNVPVFYWIDSMARIDNLTTVLEGAMNEQKSNNTKVIVQIIIYDVPDRDCAAAASNGEITCANDACEQGIETYKTQYIDPIVTLLKKYPDLTIVALIEPDSLPNLATNMNVQKCAQAQTAYLTCIPYAIQQLATLDNVWMYVDAAHGGWLGWPDNMQKFVQIIQQVLQTAGTSIYNIYIYIYTSLRIFAIYIGGNDLVRGFASNTANYQPLGSITSTDDYCDLKSQYNDCINEAIYIQYMDQEMTSAGITGKGYITDTARNGVPGARTHQESCGGPCCEWCNIDGTGFGNFPSTDTSSTGIPNLIDSFVWAKVPGESDGTSNTSASNYDYHCGSDESLKPAPQAGQWFDAFFVMLAQNAPN